MQKSELTKKLNALAAKVITLQQAYIRQLGVNAHIHFELEGCFAIDHHDCPSFNLTEINQLIRLLNIDGVMVNEYWHNQWEFVSHFHGQSPLREAQNLHKLMTQLPVLVNQKYNGNVKTLIKPVVWSGDQGQLAQKCDNIFSNSERVVHIPNAIQVNVSVSQPLNDNMKITDKSTVFPQKGENLVATGCFGEYLQNNFLETSLGCCLLFLPEEEAFERLTLKTKYGLANELCSPIDISGGHQGSIALYREKGKHNQKLGEQPILYDQYHQIIKSEYNWQATARVEHRLGASSVHYNPFVNVVFALANVIEALEKYQAIDADIVIEKSQSIPISLPLSLYSSIDNIGAIEQFQENTWFEKVINILPSKLSHTIKENMKENKLGDELKQLILAHYQFSLLN